MLEKIVSGFNMKWNCFKVCWNSCLKKLLKFKNLLKLKSYSIKLIKSIWKQPEYAECEEQQKSWKGPSNSKQNKFPKGDGGMGLERRASRSRWWFVATIQWAIVFIDEQRGHYHQ